MPVAMLRPATPLTILLLIAFVLLLLSVLSTPIIKGIPLASFQGVEFGVFGYCKGSQCTNVQVGYTTSMLHSIKGEYGERKDRGNENFRDLAHKSTLDATTSAFAPKPCFASSFGPHTDFYIRRFSSPFR